MRDLASDGVTVMVSSHLLGEIDRTATVLGIIARGALIFQGTRAELAGASAPDTLLECSDPAAADRMEIIRLSSYTEEEKFEIAKRHLLPRQMRDHGLKKETEECCRAGSPPLTEIAEGHFTRCYFYAKLPDEVRFSTRM